MEDIVKILSFLGATRDFSYIDRIANSIDAVTLLDALKDAVRAYQSYCIDQRTECIEYDRENHVGVKCPEIDPKRLENAISKAIEEASRSRAEISFFSRKLALKAYAEIPSIRMELKCKPG